MAKSFELENKIENLKAHYNVIKGNLDAVTQEINDAIELKEGYLLETENLADEIATKQKALLGLRRELESTKDTLHLEKENLSKTQERIEEEENKYQGRVADLTSKVRGLEERIKVLGRQADDAEEQVRQQHEAYKLEQEHLEGLVKDTEQEIEKKKAELHSVNNSLWGVREDTKKELEKLDAREEELDRRQLAIEEREKELKQIASEYHDNREKLETKEADLKVYERRIRRKHEELYPGRKVIV